MMARRHILSQRQLSMIRIKTCADCGDYAHACYNLEGEHVADFCKTHMHERGFCMQCFNELTEAERSKPGAYFCDACNRTRRGANGGYDDGDGDDE